jgi:lipoprotein-anchoring transpeptidase ErfK/SrfK
MMSAMSEETYRKLIQQAMQAYKEKDYAQARTLAHQAVQITPGKDDAWLILAACSSTKPRLEYLRRALSINPQNKRTREQYRLTLQKISPNSDTEQQKTKPAKIRFPFSLFAFLPWIIAVFLFGSGFIYVLGNPGNIPTFHTSPLAKNIYAQLYPTSTPLPTQVITETPTPRPTHTEQPTIIPSETRLPTTTSTPFPTATAKPTITSTPTLTIPLAAMGETIWIDIDLSEQKLYAYEGSTIVNTFIVSTGTETHPTIPGEYRIYVKYITDDMAGPGYYLFDVPYVMYYDHGFGIHGTYWHTNFGTPASHGCTNMRPEDAEWLFNWASVDTLVVIHS